MRRPPTTGTLDIVIPGQPVPASRVRVLRNGRKPYYGDRYETWKNAAQVMVRDAAIKAFGGAPGWVSPVAVYVDFYGANDTADIDNLLKAVMDALQPDIIANDRQVTTVFMARHSVKTTKLSPIAHRRVEVTVTCLDPLQQAERDEAYATACGRTQAALTGSGGGD